MNRTRSVYSEKNCILQADRGFQEHRNPTFQNRLDFGLQEDAADRVQ